MARIRQFTSKSRFPMCSLCNEPVELRTAKTDEDGKAVHEECYTLKMQPPRPMPLPRENPSDRMK